MKTLTPTTKDEWRAMLNERRRALFACPLGTAAVRIGLTRGKYEKYEASGCMPRDPADLAPIRDALGVDGLPLWRRMRAEADARAEESRRRCRIRARERAARRREDQLAQQEAARTLPPPPPSTPDYSRHDLDTIAKRRAVLLTVRRVTGQAVAA